MSMRDHLHGKSRRQSRPKAPIFRIAGLLITIAAAVILGIFLISKGESLYVRTDPSSLCPLDDPPSEVLVLVLDMSDEFSERQRLQIQNELERIRTSVARFGLIEAYT